MVLALPLLETVRAAGAASGEVSWMILVGVFFLSVMGGLLAHAMRSRSFDALFAALLAFEGFWITHWISTFPALKTLPVPDEFSLWQQLMIGSAIVLGGALLLAGILRPLSPRPFRKAAFSRIASFSKQRKNRSRIMGVTLILAAASAVASAPYLAFGDTEFGLEPVSMPIVFLTANIFYLVGKKYWKKSVLG